MKYIEMHLWGVLALVVVLAAACSGSAATAPGDEVAAATETPEVPATPTAEAAEPTVGETVVADPTAVAVQATDDELIAAAVAELDAVGASDLVAWDVLESSINDNGEVQLTLCGWTGDTVFDAVYRSRWQVEGPSGDVSASELTTSKIDGECLNSELVDSALEVVEAYGEYWAEMTADPAKIATDPRTDELLSEEYAASVRLAGDTWVSDSVYFLSVPESVPSSGRIAPVLAGRGRVDGIETLEVAVCRRMEPTYGMYRGDALLDQFLPSPDMRGEHSVSAVTLLPGAQWTVDLRTTLVWTDCLGVDWQSATTSWRDNGLQFSEVER